jgi:hypothetical protein
VSSLLAKPGKPPASASAHVIIETAQEPLISAFQDLGWVRETVVQ